MGFFDFLKAPDMNEGLKRFSATPGAVLLDVRTRSEYAGGHIPGSRNIPLQEIQKAHQSFHVKIRRCLSIAKAGDAVNRLFHCFRNRDIRT